MCDRRSFAAAERVPLAAGSPLGAPVLLPRPGAAACSHRRQLLRRAGHHDIPTRFTGLGPQVDDPVGRLDHVEVVLDHDHRVAQVDQAIEHVEQLGDVVEVQAGRRLVEQVERLAGVGPGQLGRQLDALRFAAGERRGGLTERADSRARRRTAFAARGESWECSRTARAPDRTTCRARRRSTGRGT